MGGDDVNVLSRWKYTILFCVFLITVIFSAGFFVGRGDRGLGLALLVLGVYWFQRFLRGAYRSFTQGFYEELGMGRDWLG